jgi:murein DD-endopeptidase MepM/ murein hydrolase activator NlpD
VRRILALAAIATAVPVVVWGAAAAVPEPPIDCTVAENAEDARCVEAAPAPAVEPVASVTSTTTPSPGAPIAEAPTPETATPEVPTSTTVPGGTTETTDPAATTTTTIPVDPASTTTTVDPAATTTTVDPAATTTTIPAVDPNATTTTVIDQDAAAPTTVPPPPPEDLDSDPVLPPVEAPGGRVVLPAGAVDNGTIRPITFPVAGPVTYFNDFGACRDGCARAHKGNDVIGDRLQPLLAMHDGVVNRLLDHPTAGFGIVVRDDEGWEYHLYHVNNDTPGTDDGVDDGTWRFATGIAPGVRVRAGEVVGWMGDSGNSEGSVPHAHVELHRPDGTAINPYWSLRQAQRDVNCAIGPRPDPAQPVPGQPVPASLAVPQAVPVPADPTAAVDAEWLAAGWAAATLPLGWQPLSLTGGAPGSDVTAARMWISPGGYTPVDTAALRAGDPRYDTDIDCTVPLEPQVHSAIPAELGAILSTIKAMESGGDYTVAAATSTASGAYQFLDSSWGGYGGYVRAKDAPPAVQDAKAAELAASILARNGGDVSTVPVSWYLGHVPVGVEWDTVPAYPGNRLTPREYQDRWMKRYAQLLGTPEAWVGTGPASWQAVDTSATCRTVVVDVGEVGSPQYVLTQAQAFDGAPSGRAVPRAVDPCDPSRAVPAPTTASEQPVVRLSGPS